jgi:hypothetical protein
MTRKAKGFEIHESRSCEKGQKDLGREKRGKDDAE